MGTLLLEYATKEELREILEHTMTKAGQPKLMTDELVDTLVDHVAGNYRTLMNWLSSFSWREWLRGEQSSTRSSTSRSFQLEPARSRSKGPKLKEAR